MSMNNLYQVKVKEIWEYLKGEDALFWLVNIYLFFEYVRPQTLYPAIDVIPFTRIIIIVSLGVALMKGRLFAVRNPMNNLLITFFVVILLSSFLALDTGVSYSKLSDFIVWMIIYYLIIGTITTENRFFIFMLAFLLYSFKMAQYSFRGWANFGFGFSDWGTGGGPGWFENSGEFGVQMCVFFPLALCFYLALREIWPRWKKAFFALFPVLALTSMISSASRGALFGGGAVLCFLLAKSKYRIRGLIALIIVAGLVYIAIPPEQKMRLQDMGKDRTSITRIERWEKGLEMAKMYPLFGVGYSNWSVANSKIFGKDSGLSHNVFIECVSELGYAGLTIFILMILYTFINNHRTRVIARTGLNGHSFFPLMSHGLDGALVGFLASGFFVTVLYWPFFWINCAMTVALHTAAQAEAAARSQDTAYTMAVRHSAGLKKP